MSTPRTRRASCALAVAVTLVAAPRIADACGGFFCQQAQPVDQTAERILFAQIDDETIEAHVQIAYQGPSESFSWIVPVPSNPEVSVGSDFVFDVLRQRTTRYVDSVRHTEGTCRPDPPPVYDSWDAEDVWYADASGDTAIDTGSQPPPGVEVLQNDQVGPYDFAVLRADAVEPMVTWLEDNGYDVPALTVRLLRPYLVDGMHFVAFKLSKERGVGDLRPVVLRFEDDAPMIPIHLTAVAAQPDLRIDAWILADRPATAANYAIAEPNPFLQLLGGSDARGPDIVDAAGGHAFLRPLSTDTGMFDRAFWSSGAFDPDRIAGSDAWSAYRTLVGSAWLFRSDPNLEAAMSTCFPVPAELAAMGVDARSWWNCMDCYSEYVDVEAFDGPACAAAVDDLLVAPRRHAQDLFDALPRLTHLVTWLDADEMTVDPDFCYSRDLPTRGVAIPATWTTWCHPDLYRSEAPESVEVGGWEIFYGPWGTMASVIGRMPDLYRATTGGCEGPTETIIDNGEAFASVAFDTLARLEGFFDDLEAPAPNPGIVTPPDAELGSATRLPPMNDGTWSASPPDGPIYVGASDTPAERGRSCAAADGRKPAPLAALGLIGLLALRRRR